MALHRYFISLLLTLSASFASGQKIGVIKLDTTTCPEGFNNLILSEKKVQLALAGAENYIESLIGNKFIKNICLNYCESRESGFPTYSKNINELRRLGEDTCYELQYFVFDNTDTIGYFQLLVDRNGNLIKYEYSSDLFNHPELITGFKKHFEKKFKFSYSQAVELGKQKGFWTKPYLQCDLENKFISKMNGDVFIKVKYYWSFFQIWDGGHTAILDINAETGKIEKESYIPRMPG